MHKSIDEVLAIAVVTALHKVSKLVLPATIGGVQLEGPQKVGNGLEVGTNGEDLVHEVLHANDALVAQSLLDQGVVGDGDALLVDLGVATLVHQLLHSLEVGIAVSNVGLHNTQHVDGSLVQLNKHSVVNLEQAEQLKHLANLGRHAVDTIRTECR